MKSSGKSDRAHAPRSLRLVERFLEMMAAERGAAANTLQAATHLSHILKAKAPTAGFQRANSIVTRQSLQERTNGRERPRVRGSRRIRKLVVSAERTLQQ